MEHCRYAHIHVNELAPVCEAFARLGYCEKGAQCADHHRFECPDFANKGSCEVKGCRLPHITHAARLRRARGSPDTETPSDQASSSEEDAESDDYAHALTQQADFIPLG
ncbi:hypothetical protein M011DRAFT_464486 [Sporormia fimetaria CBS 119925]|uniref:C3H1-type domain-containing protein n=1 Tax=Sporormia fimetaria CBS 119925 TaxID=1340428 RepID=A0A6A6VLJ8_9PLEO|nr:hypothetical protein M011DRAFT_464486 [Sporormia fimetaria CBS 119925]